LWGILAEEQLLLYRGSLVDEEQIQAKNPLLGIPSYWQETLDSIEWVQAKNWGEVERESPLLPPLLCTQASRKKRIQH
jgi:hypothetical protein